MWNQTEIIITFPTHFTILHLKNLFCQTKAQVRQYKYDVCVCVCVCAFSPLNLSAPLTINKGKFEWQQCVLHIFLWFQVNQNLLFQPINLCQYCYFKKGLKVILLSFLRFSLNSPCFIHFGAKIEKNGLSQPGNQPIKNWILSMYYMPDTDDRPPRNNNEIAIFSTWRKSQFSPYT